MIPTVCAPGLNIISCLSDGSSLGLDYGYTNNYIDAKDNFAYIALSGTSMATPMVSGACAILKQAFPNATPEAIRNALIMSAITLNQSSPEGYGAGQGAGLINVGGALSYLNQTQMAFSNVNNQTRMYPRQLPYAPYDFVKFPGDHQEFNVTLYSGMAENLTLELPTITGVTISVSNTNFEFTRDNFASLVIDVSIDYNANATSHSEVGFFNLTNANTGIIYDSIPLALNITIPQGKIYFDSYHGFNDLNPQEALTSGFSQIELYQAMYDMMNWNYSLDFAMDGWTTGYNSSTDASIINPSNLFDKDLLVLQTPILPYSSYEMGIITQFFDNGGSILYLGTQSNLVCVNSLNQLFSELRSGIQINRTNVADINDYGFAADYTPYSVTDLNTSVPIFTNVDHYFFGIGHTFNVNGAAFNVSSINGEIVAAGYNGTSNGHGKILAFGDYQTFISSIYNDPNNYGNNSAFLRNILSLL